MKENTTKPISLLGCKGFDTAPSSVSLQYNTSSETKPRVINFWSKALPRPPAPPPTPTSNQVPCTWRELAKCLPWLGLPRTTTTECSHFRDPTDPSRRDHPELVRRVRQNLAHAEKEKTFKKNVNSMPAHLKDCLISRCGLDLVDTYNLFTRTSSSCTTR